MRVSARVLVFSSCVLAGAVALMAQAPQAPQAPAGAPAGAPGAQAPGARAGGGRGPTNLKVLPSTWTNQQVQALMNTFVVSLGVAGPPAGTGAGCGHCHTPNENGRGFNTADDGKKEKEVARQMIKMTMAINADYLKNVGDAAVPEKVSCFTCHNGQKTPLAIPAAGWGRGGFSLLPPGPPMPPPGAGGPGGPGGGGPGGGAPGGAPGGGAPGGVPPARGN